MKLILPYVFALILLYKKYNSFISASNYCDFSQLIHFLWQMFIWKEHSCWNAIYYLAITPIKILYLYI